MIFDLYTTSDIEKAHFDQLEAWLCCITVHGVTNDSHRWYRLPFLWPKLKLISFKICLRTECAIFYPTAQLNSHGNYGSSKARKTCCRLFCSGAHIYAQWDFNMNISISKGAVQISSFNIIANINLCVWDFALNSLKVIYMNVFRYMRSRNRVFRIVISRVVIAGVVNVLIAWEEKNVFTVSEIIP